MFYKQAIRYYIMGKRWTKEEIEFIKNNSDKLTDREISEKLNRTWASVNSKRKEVGIASCKGKLTGEKHHSWKGGEEEVKCSICGKKRLIKLLIMMSNKDLYNESIWKK